jgi:hypothetical protein
MQVYSRAYAVRGSPLRARLTARAWADLPFKIFAP